jgi:large subunit ribosomal protein L13
MAETMTPEQHTIDASGQRLGRVASEIASLLMGKHRPDASRHIAKPIFVKVTNASKLLIDERKRTQKTYQRYSGYPGGLRTLKLTQVVAQKGYREVLSMAVYGMLPSNRLRAVRMKKLDISE